ncbi:uncharacterized protein LOC121372876 [Gigantopelta aegis]|uniref:uncharacterized protein LOC121372876 n=1 Tax=Gigantopelta aegis TaxID=1735272 RepID=UPI001B88BED3|nr:uncharacterized protein LOC121372876 [Gigantopelta aegis]
MSANLYKVGLAVYLVAAILCVGNVESVSCWPGAVASWMNGIRTHTCYQHPPCPRVHCIINPCQVQPSCLSRPGTKCIPNYCGGCFAMFFYVHPNIDGYVCPL